ncbi:DUF4211 domain-containing protein [Caerostris extrusa]|uniref:DUF4211 domain-containing protein n=1 Tax=Caerostris extrusa TaxID=172846 RepID=A0AAV4MJ96_CAEEX|nr:DUF4211 domain-containing protein [Caerostris extrusa]
MIPIHKIKREFDSEEESNHMNLTGNLYKIREKPSAKGKNSAKSYDFKENVTFTNYSETLPAGRAEKPPVSINSDKQVNMSKKSGRKRKTLPAAETETNTGANVYTADSKVLNSTSTTTNKVSTEGVSERLRSLRSRKSGNLVEEPKPGPSIKEEPPDYISDHFENFDDSDSDPAWTPSSKSGKVIVIDNTKPPAGQFPKKKARKPRRRSSTSSNRASKKKAKSSSSSSVKKCLPIVIKKEPLENCNKREPDIDSIRDKFLVAKTDVHMPTPYIWKVDKKSSMLQRFEISEQNGVLLYHSSFTYAARNEISVNNYVTANVRIKTPDTVQYLGPNLTEAAALALSNLKPEESLKEPAEKENFDHLQYDFTIYIQCLLSQNVDSSFFDEIKRFNDEYFLVPIKKVEAITENKKNELKVVFWDEDLKTSANTYPCISIVNNLNENAICKICKINMGNKLLQFYGHAYDETTLETVDKYLAIKTEFDVCDKCFTSVSLYHRLYHHKYNLFKECRSKASDVKASNANLESHEDVLKICLEDIPWIEKMFGELTQIWHEVEEKS